MDAGHEDRRKSGNDRQHFRSSFKYRESNQANKFIAFLIPHSQHFTTIPAFGASTKPSTSQEGRLGTTRKGPKCQHIGTHPSQRFVSV